MNNRLWKIKNIPLIIEKKCIDKNIIFLNKNGLNKKPREIPEIIVSLTSYPGRINIVPGTIASLLNQTYKPDRIILWLGKEKFPNETLPNIYRRIKECGVEIEFRKDLRSHTKYFYAMKENPDSIVITVDDDRIYNKHLVEKLVASYEKNKNCISAARVHKMTFSNDGNLNPYNDWVYEFPDHVGTKSFSYFPTGVGGVLYPPHLLSDNIFDIESINNVCHNHDDLWLKIMATIVDTKTVIAWDAKKPLSHNIYDSQTSGQYLENVIQGGNDIQTAAVIDKYNNIRSDGKTLLEILNS